MHFTEGEIRAYQDQELDAALHEQVTEHLVSCTQCKEKAESLLARSQRLDELLAALAPTPARIPISTGSARARLSARLSQSEKEHQTMWNKLFSRQFRPAWAILAIVALLTASMAFAPVRAIANSFLGLFRIQQISVVQVNPGNLPEQLGSSSQFEAMLSRDVKFEERGEPQEVSSAAEASALAGIPVRLPSSVQGEQTLEVQPGGSATFSVDLEHVQALLDEIGRSDIQLPAILDGAEIKVDVPTGVMARYGRCNFNREAAREAGYDPDDRNTPRLPNCTTLVQMPSPTISAPPGLDVAQIGEAYLQVMGMSREEAARFAQNVDWTTTFVVPIPRYGTSYQDVSVDGVQGTLIQQNLDEHPDEFMLLWVKDGIVYALTGPGNAATALKIAGSLE